MHGQMRSVVREYLVLLADRLAGCGGKGFGIHDAAVKIVKGAKQPHSVLLQLSCQTGLRNTNALRCVLKDKGPAVGWSDCSATRACV